MRQAPFAHALDELKVLVAQIVSAIENGGGAMSLRDLQMRLVDILVISERNPGITAAAEDLLAAATAMVQDSAVHAQPEARKRRLLRDARRRFEERVAGARGPRSDLLLGQQRGPLQIAA
jgi:hypothetical protein